MRTMVTIFRLNMMTLWAHIPNGISTVARYGHAADLFFTPRAHVNHVYVHT